MRRWPSDPSKWRSPSSASRCRSAAPIVGPHETMLDRASSGRFDELPCPGARSSRVGAFRQILGRFKIQCAVKPVRRFVVPVAESDFVCQWNQKNIAWINIRH